MEKHGCNTPRPRDSVAQTKLTVPTPGRRATAAKPKTPSRSSPGWEGTRAGQQPGHTRGGEHVATQQQQPLGLALPLVHVHGREHAGPPPGREGSGHPISAHLEGPGRSWWLGGVQQHRRGGVGLVGGGDGRRVWVGWLRFAKGSCGFTATGLSHCTILE